MVATGSKVGVWNRALLRIGHTRLIQSEADPGDEAEVCDAVYDDVVREVLEARDWNWATDIRPITQVNTRTVSFTGDSLTSEFTIPYAFRDSTQVSATVGGAPAPSFTVTAPTESALGTISIVPTPGSGVPIVVTISYQRVGWRNIYSLPSDFLRPVALLTRGERIDMTPTALQQQWRIVMDDDGRSKVLLADLAPSAVAGIEYVGARYDVVSWPRKFLDAVVARMAMELAAAIPKDPNKAQLMLALYDDALSKAFALDQELKNDALPVTPSLGARG